MEHDQFNNRDMIFRAECLHWSTIRKNSLIHFCCSKEEQAFLGYNGTLSCIVKGNGLFEITMQLEMNQLHN